MTDLFDFLAQSVEYQNFGMNAGTIGALGTVGFTCWQLWTLWLQFRDIRTGESIPVALHTYFVADFIVFFIYGAYTFKLAMCFNALLGIGHLLILLALMKCKPLRWWERALLPIMVVLPILMFFSRKEEVDLYLLSLQERELVFLVTMFGTLAAVAMQPVEMIWTRTRGEVGFWMLVAYTASTLFWVVYAFFGTDDGVLQFITTAALALFTLSLGLWFYFPKKTEDAVTE